jgi:branched-chain amino acid transport system ATP-binding protein
MRPMFFPLDFPTFFVFKCHCDSTSSGRCAVRFLETADLSINFGGLKAVDRVGLFIDEGEILSLIGPNGAGKTTLFNLISGFLRPAEGSVSYRGEVITGWPPHQIAFKGLVRTFQKTNIFSEITVREGVATGFHLRRKVSLSKILLNSHKARMEQKDVERWTSDVLDFAGLMPWADLLGKNLPYGKQRILEIGVALAASPRLLLLDEPASGLNPKETNELMALIRKIRDEKGITVFLIEHNMNLVVGISDRVVVLNHGKKIAEGPPGVISKDQAVIEAYLGRGFGHA